MSALSIRTMTPDDMATAVAWAAAEGWNPGLADAPCFATVDGNGFLIGEIDGAPAATISCVNYDAHFSFLGFYIVRPDQRGRGHGLRIWQAAMAHAGARVIGLDGVVAQQDNYAASGFRYAYANIRFGGIPASMPTRDAASFRCMIFPWPRSWPMTHPFFRRRAEPSSKRGATHRGTSAARCFAMGRWLRGA